MRCSSVRGSKRVRGVAVHADGLGGRKAPLDGRSTDRVDGSAMGRIFETRKATMFARWNKMAKLFTRVSKDIAIAVKAGGPNPDSNAALRRAFQNARAANMPKDKVE